MQHPFEVNVCKMSLGNPFVVKLRTWLLENKSTDQPAKDMVENK